MLILRLPVLFVLTILSASAVSAEPRTADEASIAVEVPGGDIFGFTSPTDVGNPGDKGIAFETTTRIGKRGGTYWSPTLKTQLSATVAKNLSLAISPFLTTHRIRSVPDLDDHSQLRFDGVSGEASYRILERTETNPWAATFSIEPRWARVDAVTGERVTAYSAEAKLFLDTVLVPERLYGAINLNYATASQRTLVPFNTDWEQSSGTTLSGALAYQVNENVFVGLEARYLTAFSGAFLNRFEGHGVFGGPNLLVKLSDAAALNIAWTPQIAGRANDVSRRDLDLDNFERYQLRVKFSTGF